MTHKKLLASKICLQLSIVKNPFHFAVEILKMTLTTNFIQFIFKKSKERFEKVHMPITFFYTALSYNYYCRLKLCPASIVGHIYNNKRIHTLPHNFLPLFGIYRNTDAMSYDDISV